MPSFPATGRSALRRGRVSLRGQVYLVTTTTCQRRRVFADWECARPACRIIHTPATWGDATLLAWVLMPDHWHGLLQLDHDGLSRVIARFKAAVSRGLHADAPLIGPVWDPGFHDHALRAEEAAHRAARYVVANPVRAGLAAHVGAYPYWNAIWLDGGTAPSIA